MPCYEIDGVVPVVHPTAFVHESASLIGDVIIGAGCYIGPFASLRGDFGRIIVGEGSNLQDGVVVHVFPGEDTVLEPNSHIGHAAVLHGCRIGSFALIGIGSTIMDGAEIGEEALLGAGSLVTAGMSIAPRMLALGSPAREVRALEQNELEWKARGVRLYQQLAVRSRESLRRVNPLTAVAADRGRVSTDRSVSRPLHAERERLARGSD